MIAARIYCSLKLAPCSSTLAAMLKNYLKIAFRNIRRRKVASLITATGLVLGITAFAFILQYVAFEFGMNSFHARQDNVYRLVSENEFGEYSAYLPPVSAPAIQENISSIEAATRYSGGICSGIIQVNDASDTALNTFREINCMFADEQFFDIFTFDLINGDASLVNPQTAVITKSYAIKYFGSADAVGREFTVHNQFGETIYTVTGILDNTPAQSDIQFGVLLSFNTLNNPANRNGADWADPMGWNNGFTQNFLLLTKGTDPHDIENEIQELKNSVNPEDKSVIHLQSLSDLHLAPSLSYSLPTSGNLAQVLLILGVGIMIMIIGWANYINLSTAQGIERAKQVGIQQTSGASRFQLMGQFLSETFLFALTGALLAFAVIEITQPYFNQLIDKPLSMAILNQQFVWLMGSLFFIAGTCAAGAYVAFVLSSQKPSEVLKSSKSKTAKGVKLRKALVVFQFAISIVLIVTTLIFNSQLEFMKTRDLGMRLEDRLVIIGPSIQSGEVQNTQAFKDALATLPFVKSYSGSNNIPGRGYNFYASDITGENPQPKDDKKSYAMLMVDQNYIGTYEINLKAGRNFSDTEISNGWNSDKLLVNEKAARELGYSSAAEAIEKPVLWGENEYQIAGVVADYHHGSLQQLIDPMIFLPQNAQSYFTVQLGQENFADNIAALKATYDQFYTGNPFEYFFIENEYDIQYSAEQRFENLFWIASLLAIFIACLGLFGLASYTAQTRTKEIGVRKVLGATVTDIAVLLTRDFVKLVLIGFLIGAPVAWVMVQKWLTNFAYTIEIGLGVFLIAGFSALGIALITISYQALKSAVMNPIKSLRNE